MDFQRDYDVVVAGAGVAGAAAALEAARAGRATALVEKTVLLGGLATSGLVNIFLPLCDGRGRQVLRGIPEEFLHLSLRYGPGEPPPRWRGEPEASPGERYRVVFAPAAFALALDEVLCEAGVDLWLDTLAAAPALEGRRISGIEVENKSGRGLLRARCVVDATGDADIAFRAGAPCAEEGNWLSLWALRARLEAAQQAVARGSAEPLLEVVRLGGDDSGRGAPQGRAWRGTRGEEVTRFVLESRRLLREHYREVQGAEGGRWGDFPMALPAMAQFRTTRRICGQATMSDGGHGRRVADSVGLAPDWRKAGCVWEVPWGALLPRQVEGLLVAGRCISSEGDAWQVMRVIPPAALTGQVAGLAAALAVGQDTAPAQLDAADLQEALRSKGMLLHLADGRAP
ncbi:MAG: FAD-dependent oxidoreductase [Candidatus Brocadiia bacterium]